ncbi:uncharacterized protein [Haliotis asinina]|uniref:uncharacterized protein n=1 Tax=Haliotis asinina TaxID=109174 RepID=UPI003531CB1F
MPSVDIRLIVILLVNLTPALASDRCDLEPDSLSIRAGDIIFLIQEARRDFQSVFNLTDGRCPCLVEGCAALVASGESSDIAVVDPVRTILRDINANSNISAFTVGERQSDESFSLYFISNDPFVVKRLDCPSLTETIVANETDLTSAGIGIGITFCGGLLYVTIDYATNSIDDAVLSINKTDFTVNQVATSSCKPGTIRTYNGRLYYVSCNDIVSINKTGGDLQEIFKFPVSITSFDVIDSDRIVFCDNSGGLWIHNAATGCSKLLTCKENACGDVKINSCTSLIYVVYPDDANLDIFNSTTCEREGTLPYTESVPTSSPSLEFEPAWHIVEKLKLSQHMR